MTDHNQTEIEMELDESETCITIQERVPSSIPAILVRRNGGEGSIYNLGEDLPAKNPFIQAGHKQSAKSFVWVVELTSSPMVAPLPATLCDTYQYCADDYDLACLSTVLRALACEVR